MRIEEEECEAHTPEELYARIQAAKPYQGDGMFRPAADHEISIGGKEGVWRVKDKEGLLALPVWNFSDIISFFFKVVSCCSSVCQLSNPIICHVMFVHFHVAVGRGSFPYGHCRGW